MEKTALLQTSRANLEQNILPFIQQNPDRRHFLDDDASGADLGIIPDRKRTDNLRPGTDHDIVPDRRMTLSGLLAGTAKCHALIQRHVISDDRRLADDDAASVIDKKSLADRRSRMDLNACFPGCALRNKPRPEIMPFEIKLKMTLVMRPTA